jgi:predicted alpha/beta superfamily hydrolase
MEFLNLRYSLIICFIAIISCSVTRNTSARVIYSGFVKDSFELHVDLPKAYKKGNNYSIVLYMDANLKSGNELRRQIKLDSNKAKLSNVIFVGVGHIGDYHSRRRRDLIPFVLKGSDTIPSEESLYGQAEYFYQFLTKELMPVINKEYPNNGKYTYIGHSFGGLFGYYCLIKPQPVFRNIIAMSPSLWVNNSNFFQHEALFSTMNYKRDSVTLFHSCGTGEWINKVLYSSRRMSDILNKRTYPNLKYIYKEFEGKNHNGVVPVSLEYVFQNINL